MTDPAEHDAAVRTRRRPSPGTVGWILLVLGVVGTVALGLTPSSYVVERPGPVYDVLGAVGTGAAARPLIGIPSGQRTYPTSGSLDMLTVYVDGSPQTPVNWVSIAASWFDPTRSVVPMNEVYAPGVTDKQADQQDKVEMSSSQQDATAAAFTALGVRYTTTIVVGQVVPGTPSEGVLKAGDDVVSVAGQPVTGLTQLQKAIRAHGTTTPLAVGIRRDGATREVQITPEVNSQSGKPAIGILTGVRYVFPYTVRFQLSDVGGPSAGMMLALGIYDKLTPGKLTGGAHIAGTGEITADGTVGIIGGIRQKMYGARDAGADWFLAPAGNCDEVVGHVPSGLRVLKVSTLHQALDDVKAIAAHDAGSLPTCTAK
ncbi:PDZ domain-containing protein [Pseudolysinimonas kribbensis]|uniref:YlbL family protein n=1 Tax=Pseudolysinimonas kribbensis TaxID=433641 RepID=UPI0031D3B842